MAYPASPSRNPALLSAHTPQAIRDALTGVERAEFVRRYADEMASAARTLDLTGVLAVLDTYRKIAEITQRQGPAAHRRMLEQVERLERGENVPTVPGATHKAELDERLGR